jgi:hypothetical protein
VRRWRAAVLVGLGLAALFIGASWRFDHVGRTFYTDGASIRRPAADAPVRTILWTPPAPLPLNSGDDDYEPRLSRDGQTLYLVRGRAGANADIFAATRTADGWSTPEPLAAINTPADELGPAPSPDGQSLYFASDREGGAGGFDLWVSKRDGNAWSAPANLGPLNSAGDEYSPAVSPDGAEIWFASNRARSGDDHTSVAPPWPATVRRNIVGRGFDLYRALLNAADAEPEALDSLNTPANEGTPAFSPAGDFVYFTSDRDGGYGGFDLYRARLQGGGSGPAESLESPINSGANELDPAPDLGGFALVFSSDRAAESDEAPAGDYNLYASTSREVYLLTEPADPSVWASQLLSFWHQAAPWLLWFLLSLLTILLIILLYRLQRNRHLNLITRCLVGSLLVHLIVLFLLSLWGVTTSLGELFKEPGGTRVRLASAGSGDALTMQVRGSSPMPPALFSIAQRVDAPILTSQPVLEPSDAPVDRSAPAVQALSSVLPTPEAPLPSPSPAMRPDPAPSTLASVPLPETSPATSNAESSAEVSFAQPHSPEPSVATPRSTSSAPATNLPVPTSNFAEPDRSLAATGSSASPSGPTNAPASTGAALTLSPANTAEVPTPRDAVAGLASEPQPERTAALSTPLPVGAAILASQGATDPAAISAPRSTLSTGGTLAATAPQPAPGPTTAPSLPVELAAGQSGASVALPQEAAASTGPEEATHQGEPGVHGLVLGAVDPQVPIVPGGVAADVPLPDRSGAAAGRSMAERSEARAAAPANPRPRQDSLALAQPSAELALPGETAVALDDGAAQSGESIPGASLALDSAEPAVSLATGQKVAAPTPARAAVPAGVSLFRAREAESVPEVSRPAASIALPAAAAMDLALPQETAPPEEQFAQRDPEVRMDMVERLGGSKETEEAVARSLAWLAAHQSPDGRWSSGGFDDGCGECGGRTGIVSDRAVTGLAVLCFLASDHTHAKDGPYREHMSRAIDWLLDGQSADGDLRGDETMYSHGIAAIALAEAYAMTRDRRLDGPVSSAVAFIAGARNRLDGGWRYEPGEAGDTSMLGWQAMALTSARRAGVQVPQEALDAAGRWLDSVSIDTPGLYAYQPGMPPTHSMTAEGMYVRQLLGHGRDEPMMLASVERVMRNQPRWNERPSTYAWYYATLALFQHGGPEWDQWNGAITRELLANQRKNGPAAGSWDPVDRWAKIGGRVYQTAICTLTLEVYYRYLPMYAVERGAAPAVPNGAPQPSP